MLKLMYSLIPVNIFFIVLIQQDVLDVRYLNQITENDIDQTAFVPIIQCKKGAILLCLNII